MTIVWILGLFLLISLIILTVHLIIVKKRYWLGVIVVIIIIITPIILSSILHTKKTTAEKKVNKTEKKLKTLKTKEAIFNLPADGTIIDRDSKGQRVQYKAGQYTYLKQLTKPGKYIWINKKTPSWSTSKKSCRSGPATSDGFVRLMSCSGRNMRLEITVK